MLRSKTIIKYAVLHLAELVLVLVGLIVVNYFISIPIWLLITIPVVWMLKDIFLFPKVWKAYAFEDNNPMRELIGLEATAMDDLDPNGYVRVRGELWKAEIRNPRCPGRRGDRTRVVDIKGMTLIVETCNESGSPPR